MLFVTGIMFISSKLKIVKQYFVSINFFCFSDFMKFGTALRYQRTQTSVLVIKEQELKSEKVLLGMLHTGQLM